MDLQLLLKNREYLATPGQQSHIAAAPSETPPHTPPPPRPPHTEAERQAASITSLPQWFLVHPSCLHPASDHDACQRLPSAIKKSEGRPRALHLASSHPVMNTSLCTAPSHQGLEAPLEVLLSAPFLQGTTTHYTVSIITPRMLCGEEENWRARLLHQTPAFYTRHQAISHSLRGGLPVFSRRRQVSAASRL